MDTKQYKLLFIQQRLDNAGVSHAMLDLIRLLDKERFDITILAGEQGGELESAFAATGARIGFVQPVKPLPHNPLLRKLAAIAKKIKYLLHPNCEENPIRVAAKSFGIPFDMTVAYSLIYELGACTHTAPL